MEKKFDVKGLLKWGPVLLAGVVAIVQAVGEKKDQEHLDEMEDRISKLEDKGEA